MPDPEVLLIQHCAPHYRAELLRAASAEGWRITVGPDSWGSTRTDLALVKDGTVNLVKNRWLGVGGLVIQPSSLVAGIQAKTLVIEGGSRFINSWLIVIARRLLGKETWYWGHFGHHLPEKGVSRVRSFSRRVHQRLPTGWIAYTERDAEQFRGRGLRSFAAPNPAPPCDRVPKRNKSTRANFLLLGKLAPEKQFDIAVEAFAKFREDNGSEAAHLHIVGEGSESARLGALVERLGVSDDVTLHGFLDCASGLHELLSNTTALIIPSYAGLNLTAGIGHGAQAIVNLGRDHSPEIEIALNHPEMIVEHYGDAETISAALAMSTKESVSDSTSTAAAAEVRSLYSTNSWIRLVSAGVAGAGSAKTQRHRNKTVE